MKTIFVGGCDRSGTTFLGSLLGAAKGAICTPESQFKTEILSAGNPEVVLSDPKIACNAIRRHWRFRVWGIDHDSLRRIDFKTLRTYPELLEKIVLNYAENVCGPGVFAVDTWIDHTPSNIRDLEKLFALFPEAVALHVVRDGRAVAASVMPVDWGHNSIYFAAKWWAQQLTAGLAAENFFGPHKVMRVRYEDLVTQCEPVLKKICHFAGIRFSDKMMTGGGFKVPRYTTAQHKLLLGDEIDKKRVYAWEKFLTEKQINLFEFMVGDLLSYLGYQSHNQWPEKPSHADLSKVVMQEAIFWLINRTRRFARKQRSFHQRSISGK